MPLIFNGRVFSQVAFSSHLVFKLFFVACDLSGSQFLSRKRTWHRFQNYCIFFEAFRGAASVLVVL